MRTNRGGDNYFDFFSFDFWSVGGDPRRNCCGGASIRGIGDRGWDIRPAEEEMGTGIGRFNPGGSADERARYSGHHFPRVVQGRVRVILPSLGCLLTPEEKGL